MFYTPVWEYRGFQLAQRPDTPNYTIVWYKPGTQRYRRQSTRTSDLEKAKEILIAFARDRARPVRSEPHEVPLLECLADYVERKVATKKHWSAERTALKCWLAFCEAEDLVMVADLTLGMQERFTRWRRDQLTRSVGRASNATINRDLDVMRAALRDAWKQGRLTHPPFVTSLPNPRPRERTLTPEQHAALLDACTEPHLHLFVLLATHTLQRPGAIFDLRVEQVDLERGIIDFHRPGEAMTNKRRAVVPITRSLRPHLERAITASVTGHVVEWLGAPITHVRRSFATACRHAGLQAVTPYVLRRTGATLLAAAGVPMRQIAGMLGHTTTHTTEYHYAKHAPGYLSEARDALDEIFGSRLAAPPSPADGGVVVPLRHGQHHSRRVQLADNSRGSGRRRRTPRPSHGGQAVLLRGIERDERALD